MTTKRKRPYRETVEPTVTETERGEQVFTHPAFGAISASRVSGWKVLHGSDFEHQHYITIRINPSELHRHLSNDWHHPRTRAHIEVSLSEAQWATFISSLNAGAGVPCTVEHIAGQVVPGLPARIDRQAQFDAEARAKLSTALGAVRQAMESVRGSSLSNKAKDAILRELHTAEQNVSGNLNFVADQFAEHMERTVEAAKAEIEAHLQHRVQALAGLPAVEGEAVGPRLLPEVDFKALDLPACIECDGTGTMEGGEGLVSHQCTACGGTGRARE